MNLRKREKLISLTTRWAVFISGQGSNLRALLHSPELINIKLIVSSNPKAHGILFARRHGVPAHVVKSPVAWDELDGELRRQGIERIFLLGFMKIIPADFVAKWTGKILNLHPSLLPKYPGLKSIEKAYAANDEMGCTVHEVTAEMDAGPIVKQRLAVDKRRVKSLTLDEAEFYIHVTEQRLLRESLKLWIAARM